MNFIIFLIIFCIILGLVLAKPSNYDDSDYYNDRYIGHERKTRKIYSRPIKLKQKEPPEVRPEPDSKYN